MKDPIGRQPYPWIVEDLLRWYAALGLSLLGLAMSWWGLSGTLLLSRDITWLDVAILALVLAGLGNTRWLLQGRRAVAVRAAAVPSVLSASQPAAATPDSELRLAVPGLMRHHRPGCPAIDGKPTVTVTMNKHEKAGRMPCGLCAR